MNKTTIVEREFIETLTAQTAFDLLNDGSYVLNNYQLSAEEFSKLWNMLYLFSMQVDWMFQKDMKSEFAEWKKVNESGKAQKEIDVKKLMTELTNHTYPNITDEQMARQVNDLNNFKKQYGTK